MTIDTIDTTRRKFMLGSGTGVAATALTSLLCLPSEATVAEVHHDRQYLIKYKEHHAPEMLKEMEDYLRASGLNCIIIDQDPEIYEINQPWQK